MLDSNSANVGDADNEGEKGRKRKGKKAIYFKKEKLNVVVEEDEEEGDLGLDDDDFLIDEEEDPGNLTPPGIDEAMKSDDDDDDGDNNEEAAAKKQQQLLQQELELFRMKMITKNDFNTVKIGEGIKGTCGSSSSSSSNANAQKLIEVIEPAAATKSIADNVKTVNQEKPGSSGGGGHDSKAAKTPQSFDKMLLTVNSIASSNKHFANQLKSASDKLNANAARAADIIDLLNAEDDADAEGRPHTPLPPTSVSGNSPVRPSSTSLPASLSEIPSSPSAFPSSSSSSALLSSIAAMRPQLTPHSPLPSRSIPAPVLPQIPPLFRNPLSQLLALPSSLPLPRPPPPPYPLTSSAVPIHEDSRPLPELSPSSSSSSSSRHILTMTKEQQEEADLRLAQAMQLQFELGLEFEEEEERRPKDDAVAITALSTGHFGFGNYGNSANQNRGAGVPVVLSPPPPPPIPLIVPLAPSQQQHSSSASSSAATTPSSLVSGSLDLTTASLSFPLITGGSATPEEQATTASMTRSKSNPLAGSFMENARANLAAKRAQSELQLATAGILESPCEGIIELPTDDEEDFSGDGNNNSSSPSTSSANAIVWSTNKNSFKKKSQKAAAADHSPTPCLVELVNQDNRNNETTASGQQPFNRNLVVDQHGRLGRRQGMVTIARPLFNSEDDDQVSSASGKGTFAPKRNSLKAVAEMVAAANRQNVKGGSLSKERQMRQRLMEQQSQQNMAAFIKANDGSSNNNGHFSGESKVLRVDRLMQQQQQQQLSSPLAAVSPDVQSQLISQPHTPPSTSPPPKTDELVRYQYKLIPPSRFTLTRLHQTEPELVIDSDDVFNGRKRKNLLRLYYQLCGGTHNKQPSTLTTLTSTLVPHQCVASWEELGGVLGTSTTFYWVHPKCLYREASQMALQNANNMLENWIMQAVNMGGVFGLKDRLEVVIRRARQTSFTMAHLFLETPIRCVLIIENHPNANGVINAPNSGLMRNMTDMCDGQRMLRSSCGGTLVDLHVTNRLFPAFDSRHTTEAFLAVDCAIDRACPLLKCPPVGPLQREHLRPMFGPPEVDAKTAAAALEDDESRPTVHPALAQPTSGSFFTTVDLDVVGSHSDSSFLFPIFPLGHNRVLMNLLTGVTSATTTATTTAANNNAVIDFKKEEEKENRRNEFPHGLPCSPNRQGACQLVCPLCQLFFDWTHPAVFAVHLEEEHLKADFRCSHCLTIFEEKDDYLLHLHYLFGNEHFSLIAEHELVLGRRWAVVYALGLCAEYQEGGQSRFGRHAFCPLCRLLVGAERESKRRQLLREEREKKLREERAAAYALKEMEMIALRKREQQMLADANGGEDADNQIEVDEDGGGGGGAVEKVAGNAENVEADGAAAKINNDGGQPDAETCKTIKEKEQKMNVMELPTLATLATTVVPSATTETTTTTLKKECPEKPKTGEADVLTPGSSQSTSPKDAELNTAASAATKASLPPTETTKSAAETAEKVDENLIVRTLLSKLLSETSCDIESCEKQQSPPTLPISSSDLKLLEKPNTSQQQTTTNSAPTTDSAASKEQQSLPVTENPVLNPMSQSLFQPPAADQSSSSSSSSSSASSVSDPQASSAETDTSNLSASSSESNCTVKLLPYTISQHGSTISNRGTSASLAVSAANANVPLPELEEEEDEEDEDEETDIFENLPPELFTQGCQDLFSSAEAMAEHVCQHLAYFRYRCCLCTDYQALHEDKPNAALRDFEQMGALQESLGGRTAAAVSKCLKRTASFLANSAGAVNLDLIASSSLSYITPEAVAKHLQAFHFAGTSAHPYVIQQPSVVIFERYMAVGAIERMLRKIRPQLRPEQDQYNKAHIDALLMIWEEQQQHLQQKKAPQNQATCLNSLPVFSIPLPTQPLSRAEQQENVRSPSAGARGRGRGARGQRGRRSLEIERGGRGSGGRGKGKKQSKENRCPSPRAAALLKQQKMQSNREMAAVNRRSASRKDCFATGGQPETATVDRPSPSTSSTASASKNGRHLLPEDLTIVKRSTSTFTGEQVICLDEDPEENVIYRKAPRQGQKRITFTGSNDDADTEEEEQNDENKGKRGSGKKTSIINNKKKIAANNSSEVDWFEGTAEELEQQRRAIEYFKRQQEAERAAAIHQQNLLLQHQQQQQQQHQPEASEAEVLTNVEQFRSQQTAQLQRKQQRFDAQEMILRHEKQMAANRRKQNSSTWELLDRVVEEEARAGEMVDEEEFDPEEEEDVSDDDDEEMEEVDSDETDSSETVKNMTEEEIREAERFILSPSFSPALRDYGSLMTEDENEDEMDDGKIEGFGLRDPDDPDDDEEEEEDSSDDDDDDDDETEEESDLDDYIDDDDESEDELTGMGISTCTNVSTNRCNYLNERKNFRSKKKLPNYFGLGTSRSGGIRIADTGSPSKASAVVAQKKVPPFKPLISPSTSNYPPLQSAVALQQVMGSTQLKTTTTTTTTTAIHSTASVYAAAFAEKASSNKVKVSGKNGLESASTDHLSNVPEEEEESSEEGQVPSKRARQE